MNLFRGDNLEHLQFEDDNSIDAVVTDPPYGLSFMGKKWDYDVPSVELWREVLRVLKPGGHALIACGTRTQHRMATNVEDAGFEIRDVISHLYGSGFPKSLNVNKALGKTICACKEKSKQPMRPMWDANLSAPFPKETSTSYSVQSGLPEQDLSKVRTTRTKSKASNGKQSSVEGRSHLQKEQGKLHRTKIREMPSGIPGDGSQGRLCDGASLSDGETPGPDAEQGRSCTPQGPQHAEQLHNQPRAIPEQPGAQTCGSCGKPQIADGLGTALKPACEFWTLARKPIEKGLTVAENVLKWGTGALNIDGCRIASSERLARPFNEANNEILGTYARFGNPVEPSGRWPANVLFDEDAAAVLDGQSGTSKSVTRPPNADTPTGNGNTHGAMKGLATERGFSDSGGASRFFYVAKTSKRERNAGIEGMPLKAQGAYGEFAGDGHGWQTEHQPTANHHPTVKPIKLMEYLCKLITPPGGKILDPFMGSGSTGCAAVRLGFSFIGIELEKEYFDIAKKRIDHHQKGKRNL